MSATPMNVIEVPIEEIDADPDSNCRGHIAPIDVSDLAQNIQEIGLQQPGVVMPHPHPEKGYKYKLICGHRRHFAIKLLKWKTYSCKLDENITEEEAMFLNLNENIQRENLTILQEAVAVQKIKAFNPKANREFCAQKLGMSPGWIQIREMLLNLPVEVQQEVVAGVITQTQIRELNTVLKKEGLERCYEVAKEIKKAKAAGRKPRIKKKKNRNAIRERKREEIFEMMMDINDSIPFKSSEGVPYLWPKVMSWAAGEITDMELFAACKAFGDAHGHHWAMPSCDARDEIPALEDVAI